jgi:hypothetical protein
MPQIESVLITKACVDMNGTCSGAPFPKFVIHLSTL